MFRYLGLRKNYYRPDIVGNPKKYIHFRWKDVKDIFHSIVHRTGNVSVVSFPVSIKKTEQEFMKKSYFMMGIDGFLHVIYVVLSTFTEHGMDTDYVLYI